MSNSEETKSSTRSVLANAELEEVPRLCLTWPQPGDSGKGGDPIPGLSRRIRRFAAQLARNYADDLARDPRGFRRRVVSLFRSAIPGPRPGRPGLPEVTVAIKMREGGESWATIYASCIPGYLSLNPAMRQWRQRELRDRVRTRRYQQRKRKS